MIFAEKKPITSMDFINSSRNDMLIITPAEKPKAKARILSEGSSIKNAIKAPIVVERPAINESKKAHKMISISYPLTLTT